MSTFYFATTVLVDNLSFLAEKFIKQETTLVLRVVVKLFTIIYISNIYVCELIFSLYIIHLFIKKLKLKKLQMHTVVVCCRRD